MKNYILYVLIAIFLLAFTASYIHSQEASQTATLRTLHVDWYAYSGAGVKLQYRTFQNEPRIAYIPGSFERKYFRFVESPKNYGSIKGLPLLLVHMKGQEIVFVDIYTQYMRTDGRIADFTKRDYENFKRTEQTGGIELEFQ